MNSSLHGDSSMLTTSGPKENVCFNMMNESLEYFYMFSIICILY